MVMKSSNNFHHYFISSTHDSSEFFKFSFELFDKKFEFTSCRDVFSKNQVDQGSLILIKTICKLKNFYTGNILDICCGYGAIGIILSTILNAEIDMCDINDLAVVLAKINSNKYDNIKDVFVSDLWENVAKKYNHIISNPPIKTGKKILLDLLNNARNFLSKNGSLTIVIKKNLGADSTKKYMTEIFGNCQILQRDKGYYVLQSINL